MLCIIGLIVTGIALVVSEGAWSQNPPDTLRLDALRAAAAVHDPRSVQAAFLEQAGRYRLESIGAGRLPRFGITGRATVQSDIPSIPVDLPGQTIPEPPLEQARIQAEVDWTLYDGGRIGRQIDVEQARLLESTAGVSVNLYAIREATTDVYFGTLLLQSQDQALELAARDLEAQCELIRRQAEHGTALPADVAALEAEVIGIQQRIEEVEADRRASLAMLADLTGVQVDSSDVLVLPDLEDVVAFPPAEEHEAIGRPELVQFARRAERLLAEAEAVEARTHPEVSLFGHAGVGRPSPFDLFDDEFRPYALAGVRLRWSLFDWGQAHREAQALRIQAEVTALEKDAFVASLMRRIAKDRFAIERLEDARPRDERAVELRAEVLRVARRQLEEGVLLSAAYVDRLTNLLDARLTKERHRIELAQARARLLSTLGLYPDIQLSATHTKPPNR